MIHAHKSMYGGKRYQTIKYIVVHFTGNVGDTAINNCKYFSREQRYKASAHYFVDENGWEQSVCDDEIAWSVGVKFGNAPYWGKCTNGNSISIEMCNSCTKNEKVENKTIELIKILMKKYGIDKDHVLRHEDVCFKECPITLWNDNEWKKFKAKLDAHTPPQQDKDLESAVEILVDKGIINKDTKSYWINTTNIEKHKSNLKFLIQKIGGLDYLVNNNIISDKELWLDLEKVNANHIRSLIIKYAAKEG